MQASFFSPRFMSSAFSLHSMPHLRIAHATCRAFSGASPRRLHTSVPFSLHPNPRVLKAPKHVSRKIAPANSSAPPPSPPPQSVSTRATKLPNSVAFKERKGPQYVYPEQLLIYHAGTAKLVFLSGTKLAGLLLVIWTSGVIFPAYYYSPLLPTWQGAAYLAASFLPLVFTVYAKPPFVSYVNLHLPAWARISKERLVKYADNLPSTAVLDITALKWIWPRVTRLRAGELSIHQGSLTGAMTVRRLVPDEVIEAKKWYHWRPYKKFLVTGQAGKKTTESSVFPSVLGSIARSWPATQKALAKERQG